MCYDIHLMRIDILFNKQISTYIPKKGPQGIHFIYSKLKMQNSTHQASKLWTETESQAARTSGSGRKQL